MDEDKGEYWRCTAIEPKTRLRVGRGIGQTETQAAIDLWQQVKQRAAHADYPPPVLSDGWVDTVRHWYKYMAKSLSIVDVDDRQLENNPLMDVGYIAHRQW